MIQFIVLSCLTGHWVKVDGRERETPRVREMGYFLLVAWPVVVPYYLVKTRGIKRALATFSLVALVMFGGFAAGTIILRLAR